MHPLTSDLRKLCVNRTSHSVEQSSAGRIAPLRHLRYATRVPAHVTCSGALYIRRRQLKADARAQFRAPFKIAVWSDNSDDWTPTLRLVAKHENISVAEAKDLVIDSIEDVDPIALRRDLVASAKSALSGRRDIVDVVRDMYPILNRLPEFEDDMFSVIMAFLSETDDFPTGEARTKYDAAHLRHLDETTEPYIAQMRPHILRACSQIVKRYADKLSE